MTATPLSTRRRIMLTTFGSLGDLHPYLAIGLGLRARGHDVVIATSSTYRAKVEALGLKFHSVRPDLPEGERKPELMRKIMDQRTGSEFVVREIVMPALRETYDDTFAAAEGADLLVSHPLTLTTRLVAEKKGLPWASTVLAPLSMFSAYDPPVFAPAPLMYKLRVFGPFFFGKLIGVMKWTVRSWSAPWHHLRAELSLPKATDDPLFAGQYSPLLTLALFSRSLGDKQLDWPPRSIITGFPFFEHDAVGLSPELEAFLAAGPPPLVFTLGSSAVMDAGSFYEHSAAAAKLLGRRAVLLVGDDPANRPKNLSDGIAMFDYAPFAALFPRAAAIVHQGGVGTTAQAMRAGKPMLIMPYSHDQPDHAERIRRLGIGTTIKRGRYSAFRAATALRQLLDRPEYVGRAADVGRQVRAEDGVGAACGALETLLDIPGLSV